MWEHTGRLIWTWLRLTLALLAGLGVVWLVYGWHSVPFTLAALGAALIEAWAVRGLAREWSWQASGTWWWGW